MNVKASILITFLMIYLTLLRWKNGVYVFREAVRDYRFKQTENWVIFLLTKLFK